jgi:hypothetical protein
MVGENKVSLSHNDCTSGLKSVRPPCYEKSYVRYVGFQGEPHFLTTVCLFSDS